VAHDRGADFGVDGPLPLDRSVTSARQSPTGEADQAIYDEHWASREKINEMPATNAM
jgi:hypothetical protein